MPCEVPPCAWSIPLTARPTRPGRRARMPPLRTLLTLIAPLMRLRRIARDSKRGLEPPLSFRILDAVDDGWNQGLPIGGLGAGSIGRSFRGDFARWHLDVGRHEYSPSLPDQFHIRVEHDSETHLQTLSLQSPPHDSSLSSWAWGMNGERARYHALFPRAWTEYDFSDWGLRAICEQMSPFIAHNYVESSYPVGVFAWRVENTLNRPLRVSLMFTWENAISPSRSPMPRDFVRVDESDSDRVLIELGHERTDDVYPISFGIGVSGGPDCTHTYNTHFRPEDDGRDIWNDFSKRGLLAEPTEPEGKSVTPHRTGAALCATVPLESGESREIVFSLAWDIPIMRFGGGREWYRRYTRFFDTSGDNATKIAGLALDKWREWEERIVEWQRPVLQSDRPDWLKSALFNELYYLLDGGTAWETGDVDAGLKREGIGHFAYLECFDYLFYNTYDVHFYTWALAMNFPELEKAIQRDFADAVLMEDPTIRLHFMDGESAARKPLGAVPHDLGSPEEDPWIRVNAYRAQNVGRWKDLNSKFVLQVYRVYHLTHDRDVLEYCWPAVKRAMEYLDAFDRDGDGLVENDGVPDQTYDAWVMSGPSAYCGGLYLAACEAMIRMATEMNEPDTAHKYSGILERGRKSLVERLWNGQYFNYDASGGRHSNSIMADQLAGHWYALALGLDPVVEHEKARTTLQTIFNNNVMRVNKGRIGAINGMRPDGRIDRTSIQSAEVWTGTTYALAALMIHENMVNEALATAEGVYLATYRNLGYWFRTPEAWTDKGRFRASMYMRPLAVWAIEHALRLRESAPVSGEASTHQGGLGA